MGYLFFYVPKRVLWVAYLVLGVGCLVCISYLILLTAIDFKAHRTGLLGMVAACVVSIGCFFSILSFSLLYENACRRRDERSPFLALNRFGSWTEESFLSAQMTNLVFAIIGCGLLFSGLSMAYSLLK